MVKTIQPPTSHLPPIAKIAAFTSTELFESLEYLHSLYRPQVRGSRRRRRKQANSHVLAPVDDDDDDAQHVRLDPFERAYAIRWLTALIAQLERRQHVHIDTLSPSDPIDTDTLIQQAACLLAICAGVAAAPKLHRRFSFQSPVPGIIDSDSDKTTMRTVHIDLTDIPLDNHDYASVGAQTWGGACVLAEMIAERPDLFGLGCILNETSIDDRTRGHPLRILELGAGTGLVGLTVAKLLQASPPHENPNPNPIPLRLRATIVLTDFYPAVLTNLQSNIDANFPTAIAHDDIHGADNNLAIIVQSHPLDWSSFSSTTEAPDILSTPFDIIFGADIVYEAQHAVWIRDCLTSLLALPNDTNNPMFHLVIPLRPTHTFESNTVEEVFGSKDCDSEGSHRELTILTKESILCEAYGDGRSERNRTEDVEYVYYRIGWS